MLRLPKLLQHKRGLSLSDKMLWFVVDSIFTVIVIGLTFYVTMAFIQTRTTVSDAESRILENAAYYSPDGFSFSDSETGRVYAGIVSPGRFTDSQLKALFKSDRPHIVGRFTLKQAGVAQFTVPKPESTAYTDKDRYVRWQPLAQAGGKGEGRKMPYPAVGYAVTKDSISGKVSGVAVENVFIASN